MEEEKLLKRRRRAKEEQNSELLASTLKKLAELYHSQERYHEALEAYEEEKELWLNIGKPMCAAVANRMMGEVYCSLGQYKDALKKLKEYFDVATAEKNLIEEQRALATIGRTYFFMAESISPANEMEYKKALREAKQAYLMSLKICDKLNSVNRYELWQMRSRLMLNIGLVFDCQGDIEKAVEHIEKAITINKRADLFEDTFRCYSSMASVYQKQKNSVLSLKYHDLAVEVAERLENKTQLICETLISKADVYFSVTNYRAAKQTLMKAYRVCKGSSEDKSLIERNLKIAHVLCESEEKLIALSDNDQYTKKQLYEVMGDACCVVKNFNQAITYYLKMLECCETLGYCGRDLLPALVSLSQTYRDAGRYEEALKFLQRELDVWEENPEEACKTSLNIVELLERKNASYNDLIESINKSHDYALIANNETLEIKVLKKMLRIQEKFGFTESASETRSKLDAIKADVSSECSDTSDIDDDEDDGNVETPEIINNISISDILDELEPVNVEISRPREVRRQPQGVKIRRNEKGETQLQVACIAGNYHRVKQLIDLKHPVNVTDNGGWTPLHEVCNHGHTELVELLLDNGANINDSGGDGCEGVTPLHDACSNGHLQIVQILLDRGAVIDVRTNDNKTPLDFLMEWAARAGNLSQDNKPLFENIKERLKSGLKKAGLSTDSVNLSLLHDPAGRSAKRKPTQKPKYLSRNSESKERGGKRCWSVVHSESSCSDSDREETREASENGSESDSPAATGHDLNGCDHDSNDESHVFSPVLIEEDPALEYQKVMKGLRKKVIHGTSKKCNNLSKSSVFIEDKDVVEDWLIDDMKELGRPNKKRKTLELDKGGAKLIGTLRKDVIFGEENAHRHNESVHMEIEDTPSENEVMIQHSNQQLHIPLNNKKRVPPQQSSLLESGFICVKSEDTAHQIDTVHQSLVENNPCIPTVKVHIENLSLVVPLSSTSSETLTIDWLAKEASTRYLKLEGKEPTLILHTKDGAKLAADDPVTIIDNREVTAQVTGWKTVSLLQHYVTACNTFGNECDQHIKNCLDMSDSTHSVNLNNCSYYLETLKPFIQSLTKAHFLKELLLGSNNLLDDGIKMLSMGDGLPLLEVLDLSCNGISVSGLTSLSNFLGHCQSVRVLDLSFNDFCENGWLKNIHKITEALNSLISLNLASCSMDGNEFVIWKEDPPLSNIHSIEDLDISYNQLGAEGVRGFLQPLNIRCIKRLNVGGTALDYSKTMPQIVEFFQRDDPKNLTFLDLSDCFVTDGELMEIIRCLERANHLETLILRCNTSLSAHALEAMFKMQKVPSCLDLCECDSLFSSFNEESSHFWLSDEAVKQLFSFSVTFNATEMYASMFCDKIKKQWKQIWGAYGKVRMEPPNMLILERTKFEED